MRLTIQVAGVALGAAAILAGCSQQTAGTAPGQAASVTATTSAGGQYGSGYGRASSPANSTTSTPAAAPGVTELTAATTSLGGVVADQNGRTLYMFTKDTKGTTMSACSGQCVMSWPLATATTLPKLTGVTGTVALIPTADGKQQVTLNGWPLYYYGKDAKAGDVNGQSVGQVWFVLDTTGAPKQ